MWPAFTWISPLASGTSRWITLGSSARPALYSTNAACTASIHAAIGNASRTSSRRRIRTLGHAGSLPAGRPSVNRHHGRMRGQALACGHGQDRSVRDGAVPIQALARRRLRPVGIRRPADDDPRAARPRRRRRGVPADGARLPAVRGLARVAGRDRGLVPGRHGRQRLDDERRLRGQPADALVAAARGRSPGVHGAELPAGPRARRGVRPWRRHVPARARWRALGVGSRTARARGGEADQGHHAVQPEQPDGRRPDRG